MLPVLAWIEKNFINSELPEKDSKKFEKTEKGFSSLSEDILRRVFSFLNEENRQSARLVCKTWSQTACNGSLKCCHLIEKGMQTLLSSRRLIGSSAELLEKSKPVYYAVRFHKAASWATYEKSFMEIKFQVGPEITPKVDEWLQLIQFTYYLHHHVKSSFHSISAQEQTTAKKTVFQIKQAHYDQLNTLFNSPIKTNAALKINLKKDLLPLFILSYIPLLPKIQFFLGRNYEGKTYSKIKDFFDLEQKSGSFRNLLIGQQQVIFQTIEKYKRILTEGLGKEEIRHRIVSLLTLELFLDYFYEKLEEEIKSEKTGIPLQGLLFNMQKEWQRLILWKEWLEVPLDPPSHDRLFCRITTINLEEEESLTEANAFNTTPLFNEKDSPDLTISTEEPQTSIVNLSTSGEGVYTYIKESQLKLYKDSEQKDHTAIVPLNFREVAIKAGPQNENMRELVVKIVARALQTRVRFPKKRNSKKLSDKILHAIFPASSVKVLQKMDYFG